VGADHVYHGQVTAIMKKDLKTEPENQVDGAIHLLQTIQVAEGWASCMGQHPPYLQALALGMRWAEGWGF
jgi:hypothetical protein